MNRAVIRYFLSRQWRQLQGALIESKKNEIVRRSSFSALAPEQILETLFAPPRRRKKRRHREEMTDKNQTGPKNADRRQDQKPIATKPMHARSIPLLRDVKMSFESGRGTTIKSLVRLTIWIPETLKRLISQLINS